MNRMAFLILALVVIGFAACIDHEYKMPEEKVDPGSIYFDYMAWGDEESGQVTVKLQYRAGSRNQPAVAIDSPARVEFDGEVIMADSTKFTGPYYEIIRPLESFDGKHTILFTDMSGKQYLTEFEYPIVRLISQVDSVVTRRNLVLRLVNIKPTDNIRLILTDTSFYGEGIEKVDSMYSDSIVLTKSELHALKNGPIHMEIIREEDKSLDQTMSSGGRFYITYGLKREFKLQDSINPTR